MPWPVVTVVAPKEKVLLILGLLNPSCLALIFDIESPSPL